MHVSFWNQLLTEFHLQQSVNLIGGNVYLSPAIGCSQAFVLDADIPLYSRLRYSIATNLNRPDLVFAFDNEKERERFIRKLSYMIDLYHT